MENIFIHSFIIVNNKEIFFFSFLFGQRSYFVTIFLDSTTFKDDLLIFHLKVMYITPYHKHSSQYG